MISINKLHFPSSIPAAIQQPDLHDVFSTWNRANSGDMMRQFGTMLGLQSGVTHGMDVWMRHVSYRAASCRFESQPSFIAAQLSAT